MPDTHTLGLDADQLRATLTTACRAPSLHNSQPWRFRVGPDVIELWADPERGLPAADPDGREQRMACGAVLLTLRLALRGLGVRPTVTVLPDRARPDLMAEVRRGGERPATPAELRLLAAVPRRHTNRRPFADVPVTAGELSALQRAALDEGAWLHVVDDPAERVQVAEMAAAAHRAQLADPVFVDELRRWTAVEAGRVDGVPATAGGPLPRPPAQWVLRDFRGDHHAGSATFEERPAVVVLTSHLSGRAGEVGAGQALQRVLLTATADGLAVSFLSQLVELPGPRERLRRLVRGVQPPQAVLRIGRGYPVPATRRRPLADVVGPAVASTGA
jgi:nitroreductase